MAAILASIILFTATPTPASVHVTINDLVGTWVTVRGDCRDGQHRLSANGDYTVWCFDSISQGKWFFRAGNEVVVRYDSKKADEAIITVLGIERYSDHTFLTVRYQDGSREKWMK